MRKKVNDPNGSKINSRKWAGGECGVVMRNDGEDWKSIAVSTWWMSLEDSATRRVLVSPYEIFEILMGGNRDEIDPRLTLHIGTTGNAGSYATRNIMAHPIEGIAGKRSVGGVNASLRGSGHMEIPIPLYGYLRGGCYYIRR